MTGALEHHCDTDRVVAPVMFRGAARLVEIKLDLVVEAIRFDLQLAIVARPDRGEDGEVDGRRHDEAVVVIGVFADQIDAPGRAKLSWSTTVQGLRHRALSATGHLPFSRS